MAHITYITLQALLFGSIKSKSKHGDNNCCLACCRLSPYPLARQTTFLYLAWYRSERYGITGDFVVRFLILQGPCDIGSIYTAAVGLCRGRPAGGVAHVKPTLPAEGKLALPPSFDWRHALEIVARTYTSLCRIPWMIPLEAALPLCEPAYQCHPIPQGTVYTPAKLQTILSPLGGYGSLGKTHIYSFHCCL